MENNLSMDDLNNTVFFSHLYRKGAVYSGKIVDIIICLCFCSDPHQDSKEFMEILNNIFL